MRKKFTVILATSLCAFLLTACKAGEPVHNSDSNPTNATISPIDNSTVTDSVPTGNADSEVSDASDNSEIIYGTMQLSYSDLYLSEGGNEVDAVSSATQNKWQNENFTAGTFNSPHANDEGGDILGVIIPVSITKADLELLGDNNYSFTATEDIPDVFKPVTLKNNSVEFSPLQCVTQTLAATATLSSNTAYGDYVIDLHFTDESQNNLDIGTIYGAMLKTTDGSCYGLRHLENIWRSELAWSVGFVTSERHGNSLSWEPYKDIMGKTIDEIVYISSTGYHSLKTELYVPVKFEGSVDVSDAKLDDGFTNLSFIGLPGDYDPAFEIMNLSFELSDNRICFSNALPGSYSITVNDKAGKYAPLLDSFVLSTDVLPVTYSDSSNRLEAASDEAAELAKVFLKNLSTVEVNGTPYNASGRGAVNIITAEGVVDTEAAVTQGRGEEAKTTPIFTESGEYTLTLTSVGFSESLTFTVTVNK